MPEQRHLAFASRLARGLWVERSKLRANAELSQRQGRAALARLDQIERLVLDGAPDLLVGRLKEVGAARLACSREAEGFSRLSGDWQPVWQPYRELHGLLLGALDYPGLEGLRRLLKDCLRDDLEPADRQVLGGALSTWTPPTARRGPVGRSLPASR